MKRKILLALILICLAILTISISVSAETYGDLTYEIIDGEIIITDCNSSASGELNIPNEIEGCPVTAIGDWTFHECQSITSVSIPNTVSSIGNLIFYNCPKLSAINVDNDNPFYSSQDGVLFNKNKTVLIKYPEGNPRANYFVPDSVTSIADYAFNYCTKLTNISFDNYVTHIGNDAFVGCTRLSNIYVAENNPFYSSQDGVLFNKDKTILYKYPIGHSRQSYAVPDSVSIIGAYSFSSCINLSDVVIGNNVTTIECGAFDSCINLASIVIPDSVTYVGDWAFYYCWNLESITLPNNITYISDWTFSGCTNLHEVCFMGTEEIWNMVSIGYFNEPIFDTSIYFDINVKGISLDKDSIILRKNHTEAITATITPYYATNHEIIWTSTNPEVVTVENGIISGISNGIATIKAKTADGGYEALCEVIAFSFEDDFADYGITETGINWALSGCGTFEMVGYGETTNYSKISSVPWYGERIDIKEIIIDDGITNIGARSFYGCINAEKVTIPPSVTSIGTYAFKNCDLITIYGEKDSYAEEYAIENEIAFINTKKAEIPLLTVDLASNKLKWYFDITIKNYSDNGIVYISIYDEKDQLLTTISEELISNDITSLSLSRNANATYAKVFVWDESMNPITLPVIIEL